MEYRRPAAPTGASAVNPDSRNVRPAIGPRPRVRARCGSHTTRRDAGRDGVGATLDHGVRHEAPVVTIAFLPARYTRRCTRAAPGCRRPPDRSSREVPRVFLLVRARLGVLRLIEHGQRHLGQIHDLHGETAVISRVLSDPSPHGETRTAGSGAADDHMQHGAVSPPGFIRDPPVDG
jgi:hypothetical protein